MSHDFVRGQSVAETCFSHWGYRTPCWASEEKHSQQTSMPYHPTLTSSTVHHLSHQSTSQFYRITMSIK